jgi:NAD-dependent dihydropyrimidine dehydrogenase PreA subunit
MAVEINYNLCGKCLGCATICPEELFFLSEGQLRIKDGCIDCGHCIKCCPVKAITKKITR